MVKQIKLLPRYCLTFGLWWGVKTFLRLEILQLNTTRLKGLKHKVRLRSNSSDMAVFREIFLLNSYNIKLEEDPKVIIDGGGNIGLTSVYLAKKFPGAKIYTFEPDQGNFEILQENVKPYEHIVPIRAALWAKDISLKIVNKNVHQWAFEVVECAPTDPEAIAGISIETVMREYSINCIDLLKLDIEGSEKELFAKNFQRWIPNTKQILVEFHDWLRPGSSKSVFKTMAEYDFDVTIVNGMLLMKNKALKG